MPDVRMIPWLESACIRFHISVRQQTAVAGSIAPNYILWYRRYREIFYGKSGRGTHAWIIVSLRGKLIPQEYDSKEPSQGNL